ncbi:MAG: serine/threonine protein kinase [Myxococcales bacterium]|nr:serine/threonine protein kinase [Myxococcales bacterium]
MRKTKAISVEDIGKAEAGEVSMPDTLDDETTDPPAAPPPVRKGDDFIDRLIGGKYRIISLIGEGGFGSVYRAEQQPVGRIVALKVIRGNAKDDTDLRARFLREAKSVARMQSPHIVTLYDYGEEPDGLLYGVFEFVDGRSLDRLIQDEGALTVPQAVTWTIEVLEALSVAHDHGIVHRDLKPANIMIAKGSWGNQQARVLDFGIAKVVDHDGDDLNQTVATRQGLILGTPHYMAPEQAHATDIDGRTDLYAVGILLYAMLSGRPPFDGKSAYSILEAHVTKPVGDVLALLPPAVPTGLREVIGTAMAKLPDQRWSSAREMAEALAPFVGELGETQALSAASDKLKRPTLSSVRLPALPSIKTTTPPVVTTTLTTGTGGSKTGLIVVVAVLVLALAGGAVWFFTREEKHTVTVTDEPDAEVTPVKIRLGTGQGPAPKPDAAVAVPPKPDAAVPPPKPDAAVPPPPDAAIAAPPDTAPDAGGKKPPVRRWRRQQRRQTQPDPKGPINLEEF